MVHTTHTHGPYGQRKTLCATVVSARAVRTGGTGRAYVRVMCIALNSGTVYVISTSNLAQRLTQKCISVDKSI